MIKERVGPTVKITLEFADEAEANRWLNQHPYTPPPIAGEFTDEQIEAAIDAWNDCLVGDGIVKAMRAALRAAGSPAMTMQQDQDSDRGQRYVVSWIEEARPRCRRHVIGRTNDLHVANNIALVGRAKYGADNVWIADRQWAQRAGLR